MNSEKQPLLDEVSLLLRTWQNSEVEPTLAPQALVLVALQALSPCRPREVADALARWGINAIVPGATHVGQYARNYDATLATIRFPGDATALLYAVVDALVTHRVAAWRPGDPHPPEMLLLRQRTRAFRLVGGAS